MKIKCCLNTVREKRSSAANVKLDVTYNALNYFQVLCSNWIKFLVKSVSFFWIQNLPFYSLAPPHQPLSVTSEMKRDQNFPVVTSSCELFLYLWCFSSRKLSCSATRAHLLGISCTRERQMNIVLRSNLIETAFLLLELIISSVV